MRDHFPPRPVEGSWAATETPRGRTLERLLASPLVRNLPAMTLRARTLGLIRMLDWLEEQPRDTWQDRWLASGADAERGDDWRRLVIGARATDPRREYEGLGPGLLILICGDVIRPSLGWLLTAPSPRRLAASMALVRDPGGFAQLAALCASAVAGSGTTQPALERIAAIVAAKGGVVADIAVGDCLELLRVAADQSAEGHYNSPFFYQLLHSMGVFPPTAPPTVRTFVTSGQRSVEELLDRYRIESRPIRDLLVDYLRERQSRLDYTTLESLSRTLGNLFWRDLELHHHGINSLRLPPQVATAWKQRLLTKTTRTVSAGGQNVDVSSARISAMQILATVRAFYLDIGEWALDEPARWGPWVEPSPVRAAEISHTKDLTHRKSRMDQRTRQRLPVLPALAAAVDAGRHAATQRLDVAVKTPPGELFTVLGETLRRSRVRDVSVRVRAEHPETGVRRDLTLAEHQAFWAWAAVEVLRHSGIRIEELTELSHHSLVQYRVPGDGELIPLLHIAPSKTDTERLLVVSPDLADVLSIIIRRVRGDSAGLPLVVAYDQNERVWNPPAPLLFQRRFGAESRPIPAIAVRELINIAVDRAGITDNDNRPLRYSPHDFRRIFTTDAIMNGMPPHIAQLLLGHKDINTTMGYKAVYPEEAVNGHRAFIARRRALRPGQEYRQPTNEEWDEFLGHFERRKLALGDCGRAYGTSCIHEHSCVRCPLLRVDPNQRLRLLDIQDNLVARIAEAEHEGWTGEAEGLRVSLAAAKDKLAQADTAIQRRSTAVELGMPGFPQAAGLTISTSTPVDYASPVPGTPTR